MIRNTLNHCLKFTLRSIFCHICYGKISEKNVNTFFKVKLFISKTSDSCFQGFDFFQMLLASHRYWKYQTSSLIFIKNKESLQEGWIPKISVACISCMSCQQTRPISSSTGGGGEGVGQISVKIILTAFCMHLTLFNQVQVDVHVEFCYIFS